MASGACGWGAAAGGTGEQRQAEGEGLAGAGTAAAEDVAARQRVRQSGALDRERLGHPLRGEGLQERARHVQRVERVGGGQRGGEGLGQGEFAALGGYGLAAGRAAAGSPGVLLRPVGAAALDGAVAVRSVLAFETGHTELPSWGIPGFLPTAADCLMCAPGCEHGAVVPGTKTPGTE
ncbi:hypothetical protein GCM10020227_19940 [Streptomyces flavovirens]